MATRTLCWLFVRKALIHLSTLPRTDVQSLYIHPGMLSGSDDLDGYVAQIRSYTSLALNVTSLISTVLLYGRNLCRRLLTLIATSLVNSDVKKLSAFAFSEAEDRVLPL